MGTYIKVIFQIIFKIMTFNTIGARKLNILTENNKLKPYLILHTKKEITDALKI